MAAAVPTSKLFQVCEEFLHLRRIKQSLVYLHKLIHRDIASAGVTDLSHVHKTDVTIFVLLCFLSMLRMYIISMM